MRYSTHALVISRQPFSESSQVVRLLTEEHGFVAALARGSCREKSAFGGPLDLVTLGVADLTRKRASDLELLHGFTLERPWRGLRDHLTAWLAASHVLELLRAFAWPRDRSAEIFTLARATFESLDTSRTRDEIEACLAYHDARLLGIAGFRPQLDHCCSCSRPRETNDGHRRARFSPRLGGHLCESCASRDAEALRCSESSFELLARLLGESVGAVRGPVTPQAVKEVRLLLDRFAEERLEQRLFSGRWVADGLPSFRRRW
jgi:DNA repair protein RecO (recombination protein O)